MRLESAVVLLAAMWIGWFDFGLQTSFGALFLALTEEFGENRSTTSSVQAMFVAINQGLGVIAGILVTKYGIMRIMLIGSTLIPLGFFIASFATELVYVNISVGFMSAVGVSLMFVSSTSLICQAFSGRMRDLALSLHSVSISLAGISYPFIFNWLIQNYMLNGTFLIISGFLLNNFTISLLFVYFGNLKTKTERDNTKHGEKSMLETIKTINNKKNIFQWQYDIRQENNHCYENSLAILSRNVNEVESNNIISTSEHVTKGEIEEIASGNIMISEPNGTVSYGIILENKIPEQSGTSYSSFEFTQRGPPKSQPNSIKEIKKIDKDNQIQNAENSSEIFNTFKTQMNLEDYKQSSFQFTTNGQHDINNDTKIKRRSSITTEYHKAMSNASKRFLLIKNYVNPEREISFLKDLKHNLNMIMSISYVTFVIATGAVIGTQNGYISLLLDIFKSKGFSENQGLLAFFPLNLCGLVARIIPGLVKQRHGFNSLILPIVFTLSGVVGQLLILFSDNYFVLMAAVGLTGIPMGGVISASATVVAKIVGPDNFALGFGLLLTQIGILATFVGPVYGVIRDLSNSYSIVIAVTACAQLTGSMLYVATMIARKKIVSKDSTLERLVASIHTDTNYLHFQFL